MKSERNPKNIMPSLLLWVLAVSSLSWATCDTQCVLMKTCAQCIGYSFKCVWCSAKNYTGSRCQTKEYHAIEATWCPEDVYNPQIVKHVNYVQNDHLNSGKDGTKVVQIRPQNLSITVRPRETVTFNVTYKPAEDYPLDVYYLMDYSYTMQDYLNLLQTQAKEIHKSLSNFTRNSRLGVGTFVEKPGLPYASPFQAAYSFRNHLALTDDIKKFMSAVGAEASSSNYDTPEAGLDALMQAMVCKERLNWREDARRIIVLCTDSTYHSAGDGKMVGAVKLNDMQCHLNATGYYDQELEQDYPTVSQINRIAMKENTIIIFNVLGEAKREYKALAKMIKGAKYVELKKDSNIVDTITDVYLEAVRNLQINVHAPNEKIRVRLTPDCTKPTKDLECKVEHQKEFNLTVSITLESCISDKDDDRVSINPTGLQEKLIIHVKTQCKCDCENHSQPDAKECTSEGTLECGICTCNKNRFGNKCQCPGNSTMVDLDKCRAKKDHSVLCSGRGECNCGECKCESGFSGEVCQYDDKGCPWFQGRLCSDRGRCGFGRCTCQPGWTRDDCSCSLDIASCRAPHSQGVCSGNGDCVCGECECTKVDSENKTYTGAFCDACHDCDEKRCRELEKYVQCVYSKSEKICDEEFETSNTAVARVNKTEFNAPEYHLAKLCKTVLEDGTSIVFKHMYEGRELHIIIQNELEEPDRANMWIATGSSIGAILLLGLLGVVAWKLLVDIHDAREYEKFSKQLDESVDASRINPFYKPATTTIQNPAFNRMSRMQ